jgi:hypothetical protein
VDCLPCRVIFIVAGQGSGKEFVDFGGSHSRESSAKAAGGGARETLQATSLLGGKVGEAGVRGQGKAKVKIKN